MIRMFDRMITYYLLAAVLCWGLIDVRKAYMYRLQRNEPWANGPIEYSDRFELNDPLMLRLGLLYYKTLLGLFPEASQAYGLKGYCYFYLNLPKKAIRSFQEADQKEPNFYWHKYNLGLIYYAQGDYQKAEEYFQQIASQDFKQVIFYTVYNPLHKLSADQRIYLMQQAQEFAAKLHRDARQYWLKCLFRQGKYEQIVNLALNLLQQDKVPGYGFFAYYGGMAAYHIKNYAFAVRLLSTAIQREYNPPEAYRLLAASLENTGEAGSLQGRLKIESLYEAARAMEGKFRDDSLSERLVIHPWVKYIPIGKEVYFAKAIQ